MLDLVDIMSAKSIVFRNYVSCCCILILKMMLMSLLTGRQRMRKKIFSNPEDTKTTHGKVKFDDVDIERVRRGHLNDLENIPIFFVASFLYMLTNPTPYIATSLFWAFTIARIMHTIVYTIFVIPQPARAIAWVIGYGITGYMAVVTGVTFYFA